MLDGVSNQLADDRLDGEGVGPVSRAISASFRRALGTALGVAGIRKRKSSPVMVCYFPVR